MKKKTSNEFGMTLIEILATVIVLSIVIVLVTGIILSSTNESKKQTIESKQIVDSSYIFKVITKDLRNTSTITFNTNEYIFLDDTNTEIVTYTFYSASDGLKRNSTTVANNIENFSLSALSSYSVRLSFTLNGQNYTTDIAFRRGDS